MLRLTVSQQREIESARREQFLREAVRLLKHDAPAQYGRFTDETLLGELRALSRTAAGYGLVSSSSFGVFIALALEVGHDFHTRARAVNTVLSSNVLAETDKVEWLQKWYAGLVRYGIDQ
jgi:hypothetical protein